MTQWLYLVYRDHTPLCTVHQHTLPIQVKTQCVALSCTVHIGHVQWKCTVHVYGVHVCVRLRAIAYPTYCAPRPLNDDDERGDVHVYVIAYLQLCTLHMHIHTSVQYVPTKQSCTLHRTLYTHSMSLHRMPPGQGSTVEVYPGATTPATVLKVHTLHNRNIPV